MLKFPAQARLNKDMSYSNSCFSEYLGCQIYESIGMEGSGCTILQKRGEGYRFHVE